MDEALDIVFAEAEANGIGLSFGAVGRPQMGKTTLMKAVCVQAVERELCEFVFIHDAKKTEPQYEGRIYETMTALRTSPPGADDEDADVIVLHPLPSTVDRPTVEEVSAVALEYGRAGKPCAVVADELFHGLKAPQTWAGENPKLPGRVPTFPYLLREGSSQHVSVGFTTQIPQQLPTEALDLAQTIAVFHLKARSARYIARLLFDGDERVAEVIRRLDKGEFIIADGDDWNGVIYRTPKPESAAADDAAAA